MNNITSFIASEWKKELGRTATAELHNGHNQNLDSDTGRLSCIDHAVNLCRTCEIRIDSNELYCSSHNWLNE